MSLFTALTLPNGVTLPNRIAKAAMEENMADSQHTPSDELIQLYKSWAEGGVGLIITGNVMVDRHAMTGPGGVILENDKHLDRFKTWAATATSHGAKVVMQINHPGRQMPVALGQPTIAPSAIALNLGSFSSRFAMPKEMTASDIQSVQQHFIKTALLAEQSGFSGVQVHAAHGYLLSQFLSPLSNKRQDQWGGSLENRARLLIDIVKGIRAAVAAEFIVAVKLNSADFQRGGFSPDDAKAVVQMLNHFNVDLIELSGGSYEAPAMQGEARDGRTLAREAYFLEFAQDILQVANIPLMVTGGIRRRAIAEQVIASGVAIAGMGTALSINPHLVKDWQAGVEAHPVLRPIHWKNKPLASVANMAMVKFQLKKLSQGQATNPQVSPAYALLNDQFKTAMRTKCYKRWVAAQA